MSFNPNKIRVAILRGGPSDEYEVSLESGKNVLDNLLLEYYEPIDIFISKEGIWHESGIEKSIDAILKKCDVVFNCLHGHFGEDGVVQTILDKYGMFYTGSKVVPSALGMNKAATKKIYEKIGLKTPFGICLRGDDMDKNKLLEIYKIIPMPLVVKPVSSGSSLGVKIVHSLPELEESAVVALEYSPSVIVEEFISGKEGTCGTIDSWGGKEHYALLPVEIKHQRDFFDYESKYSDKTEEICPSLFSEAEKKLIEEMTVLAHKNLGLRHYSRSDFIINPKRGIFILETNTLPGLTKNSLLPKSLHALGIKFSDFLRHIISLAMKNF